MKKFQLTAVVLSCVVASASYGLSSTAHKLKQFRMLSDSQTGHHSKAFLDNTHDDFNGKWTGECQRKGANTPWDPDRNYETLLDVSYNNVFNVMSLTADTNSQEKADDDFSQEFMVGGVDNNTATYPNHNHDDMQHASTVVTNLTSSYWSNNGQKVIYTSTYNNHSLTADAGENSLGHHTAVDETTLELVDGKLLYSATESFVTGDYKTVFTTTCNLTKAVDNDSFKK